MEWKLKNGEYYLYVDGYRNKYGKGIVADFAFCELKKNTIMYVIHITGETGELIAYDEKHAKEQVEGLVKSFCRSQIEYYDNITRQLECR